jgi:tRNA(fMet)-specific endonuclease VapC
MLQFLLDTDHLTLFQYGHSRLYSHIQAQAQDAVGLAVVTVEESLRGRLAALAKANDGGTRIARYAKLLDTLDLLNNFPIVPFDQAAESHLQRLRTLRLRIGSQDLKIAAITLANNLRLVTRNKQDFGQIPGLVCEDWSV